MLRAARLGPLDGGYDGFRHDCSEGYRNRRR